MEKLETFFFVGYPGAMPILFVPALCLASLDSILSYLIFDNKNIHQVPLVSAQLAWALPIMGKAQASWKISTRRR